jgi:hypothetical protein
VAPRTGTRSLYTTLAATRSVASWVSVLALGFSGVTGCAKHSAPPSTASATPSAAVADEPAADDHVHGAGKKTKFRETAVYLDGKIISVMRRSELPPSVAIRAVKQVDGLDIPRYFRLYDYVTALGVDAKKIQAIQLYGSHNRIATIAGDELVKFQAELVFDYTQQVTGKPRARWWTKELRHRTYIDTIFAMTIYVDKPAPTYAPHDGLRWADGTPVDGIPYDTGDVPKGTRVYVDGKMVGYVKRKLLTDSLLAKGSEKDHARFSFAAFLDALGADANHAKAIDFVSNDDLVARVGAGEWKADGDAYVFSTPPHAHGKVKATIPGDKQASISSVQLFVHTAPPARIADPEALDAQNGSDDDQCVGQNAENCKGGARAQGMNGDSQDDE